MNIGQTIRQRREALGWTQAELAERANVSQPMIAQIERGSKSPTVQLAQEVAAALDCTLQDLFSSGQQTA